jgi:hypothetical protein
MYVGAGYAGRAARVYLLGGTAALALMGFDHGAHAQTQLPEVVVTGAKVKPQPRPVRRRPAATRPAAITRAAPPPPPAAPVNAAVVKNDSFDAARSTIYTTVGTTSDTLSHQAIQALPQGANAPVEKVLLQTPGVSQDSAVSGSIHVRNDHANVQYRINGVMLPDGVTGFSTLLNTSLIGSLSLITGALPAEFGLRTVGLVDIATRTTFSTIPAASASTAAAAAPSSRASNMAARRAINAQRPRRQPRRRSRPIAFPASNTCSPAAICRPPRVSRIRCPRSMPSTTSRNRPAASPISRPSSTLGRASV